MLIFFFSLSLPISVQTIVSAMSTLIPPVPLANPEDQFRIEYIKSIAPLSDFDYSQVRCSSFSPRMQVEVSVLPARTQGHVCQRPQRPHPSFRCRMCSVAKQGCRWALSLRKTTGGSNVSLLLLLSAAELWAKATIICLLYFDSWFATLGQLAAPCEQHSLLVFISQILHNGLRSSTFTHVATVWILETRQHRPVFISENE